jgi:hypothetical protein
LSEAEGGVVVPVILAVLFSADDDPVVFGTPHIRDSVPFIDLSFRSHIAVFCCVVT